MAQPVPAAQLVARCRAGDEGAWAELVERFSRYVYAIATQGFRLRDHDAEDVFQEVFAKVYERLDSLRSDEALDVHEAMSGLSDNCREILDRFFARDETYRTIGEQLELPAGTIASRISRCLVKLRDELEGRNRLPAQSGEQVNV